MSKKNSPKPERRKVSGKVVGYGIALRMSFSMIAPKLFKMLHSQGVRKVLLTRISGETKVQFFEEDSKEPINKKDQVVGNYEIAKDVDYIYIIINKKGNGIERAYVKLKGVDHPVFEGIENYIKLEIMLLVREFYNSSKEEIGDDKELIDKAYLMIINDSDSEFYDE